MTKSAGNRAIRTENALAIATSVVLGVSVLTLVGVLIAYFAGLHELPAVFGLIPMLGLPLGILLLISLVILTTINRKKEDQ